MKLLITERFGALSLLPKETDFVTLKVVRDLQDTLALSEKELKEYDVKTVVSKIDGQPRTQWSVEAAKKEADLKIGEKATDIIVDALKKLNDEKKLTADHFSLYEKFVVNAK